MSTAARTAPAWACEVVCSNCRTVWRIDWRKVTDSGPAAYRTRCGACGQEFDFTEWRYESSCPACGQQFSARMRAGIDDAFAHLRHCDGCHRLIEYHKTSPPRLAADAAPTA